MSTDDRIRAAERSGDKERLAAEMCRRDGHQWLPIKYGGQVWDEIAVEILPCSRCGAARPAEDVIRLSLPAREWIHKVMMARSKEIQDKWGSAP